MALFQVLNQIFVHSNFCSEGNFQKYVFSIEDHEFHNRTDNKKNMMVFDGPSSVAY